MAGPSPPQASRVSPCPPPQGRTSAGPSHLSWASQPGGQRSLGAPQGGSGVASPDRWAEVHVQGSIESTSWALCHCLCRGVNGQQTPPLARGRLGTHREALPSCQASWAAPSLLSGTAPTSSRSSTTSAGPSRKVPASLLGAQPGRGLRSTAGLTGCGTPGMAPCPARVRVEMCRTGRTAVVASWGRSGAGAAAGPSGRLGLRRGSRRGGSLGGGSGHSVLAASQRQPPGARLSLL